VAPPFLSAEAQLLLYGLHTITRLPAVKTSS
jgi:hypothetical protein